MSDHQINADTFLHEALRQLPIKPNDTAPRPEKKHFSELLSEKVAQAFAEEFRRRGLKEARPAPPGEIGISGAERRLSGGIGAKKVDVTWATEESGLLLAISIKSINFIDRKSKNYQKNLTNRRGDMLFEAVTLHRRFPYAVLGGFFFLDQGAANDESHARRSTFINAHSRFRLFTGRADPGGRDEQYERFYFVLFDANPFNPTFSVYQAGQPHTKITLSDAFDDLLQIVAERNPDFYQYDGGKLIPVR